MADLDRGSRPRQLTAAAGLAATEGLVALGFGVAELAQVNLDVVAGVGVALVMIGFAVLLVAAARALLRGRRWARAPIVVVQLIMLPVGWSFRGGSTTWVSAVMIIVAVVTLVLVLHPRSTRALVAGSEVPGSSR